MMKLVFDGTKAIADKMGMSVEQFKALAKKNFENDPATVKAKKADICITGSWCNGATEWTVLRLNKPLSFFPELKAGRSCKIHENYVEVTDKIMEKLYSNKKYNIVTDF